MIQRKYFFDRVRSTLGGGTLAQSQVDGLNVMLERADARRIDFRQFAYILATAWHETAYTLQPIEEYGRGAGHEYGVPDPVTGQTYYGRGFVQLTWAANYKTCQQKADDLRRWGDRDIYLDAGKALDLDIATDVIFYGMRSGMFTGAALGDFVNADDTDFYNARKVVNGLDCADKIADEAGLFLAALTFTPGEVQS